MHASHDAVYTLWLMGTYLVFLDERLAWEATDTLAFDLRQALLANR